MQIFDMVSSSSLLVVGLLSSSLVSASPAPANNEKGAAALKISKDGSCGGKTTCAGSTFGNCCSQYGYCGSSDVYCGTGCQSGFGTCGSNSPSSTVKPASSSAVRTSSSLAPTNTNKVPRDSLSDCLNGKDVPISLTQDDNFKQLAEPYNLRLPYTPAVIVLPTTSQHVQDAVTCAAQNKIKVQAKSGGHSYASFSSGGKNGSMIIDLEGMHDIDLDTSTNIAKVGGGVRLGNLAQGIYDQGKRALPHGTCPGVGIGGHATHGGYGYDSRLWGLAMDTIVGLDVVLANGSAIHATSSAYPDIYWALRGAADSIGVVTSFYMQTEAAPDSVTYFSYSFSGMFDSQSTFTNTLLHVQDFAQNASVVDGRLGFGMYMDGSSFSLSGSFIGAEDEYTSKIAPELLRSLPSSTPTVTSLSWIDYLIKLSGQDSLSEPTTGYDAHDNFYAKSLTVPESAGLSSAALDAFYTYVTGTAVPSGASWYVIINLYGGPDSAINSHDTSFAAYSDRDSLWVFQNYGETAASMPWIQGLNDAVTGAQPQTTFGAYLNYVDPALSADEAHSMYYSSEVYDRLVSVKKEVDQGVVFWNPQAVGA